MQITANLTILEITTMAKIWLPVSPTNEDSSGWQSVHGILALFGKQKKAAHRHYRKFIRAGVGQGKKPKLTGDGLFRSTGVWGGTQVHAPDEAASQR